MTIICSAVVQKFCVVVCKTLEQWGTQQYTQTTPGLLSSQPSKHVGQAGIASATAVFASVS